MGVNSYYDIETAVSYEKEKYRRCRLQLDELSINPFSRDRFARREGKRELEDIQEKISSYCDLVDSATTFKRKELLPFLCQYLTLTEGEEYVVTKLEEENDDYTYGVSMWTLGNVTKNVGLSTIGMMHMLDSDDTETYYLVSTAEDACKVESIFEDYDLDSAIEEAHVTKCFYVRKKKIHMAENLSLKEKYRAFPSLEECFRRLVDLRLQNPSMSDTERFGIVLEEKKGRILANKF